MIEWTATPQSSNIRRVGYDADTQDLTVEFAGGSYVYSGVDKGTADVLAADPSPGSFFARHVKTRYPTRKL